MSFQSAFTSKPKFIAYFVNPTASRILSFFIIFAPSKFLLEENVVDKLNGIYPGYWRMFLRKVIGKLVSILPFGIGYPWLWAIWDKNNQMWHDKRGVVQTHVELSILCKMLIRRKS